MKRPADPTGDAHEDIDEVQASLSTPQQLYFRERGWEATARAPERLDLIARAFLTALSTLTTVYFAAIALSKIPAQQELFKALAVTPVVLWIGGIACALVSLLPRTYLVHSDAPDSVRRDYFQKGAERKLAWSPLGGARLFRDDTEQIVRVRAELEAVGEELGGASVDQVGLAWVLRHPADIVPIVGTGKIDRVRAAASAVELELSREQWLRVWVASTGRPLR